MTLLRQYAHALGGDVSGNQICFPGPGHSSKDRSCTLRFAPTAPDGFLVYSHAGDDFRVVRDHVYRGLRLDKSGPQTTRKQQAATLRRGSRPLADDDAAKRARARRVWDEGVDPRGTLVERYLASRLLVLDDEIASSVLRFHPACPWRADDGSLVRAPAMLSLYQEIRTGGVVGIQRTRLTPEGMKIDRRMLGSCGDGAIKFDADAHVTTGLTIGEGAETVLTARQLGLRPAWALGSSGAIGKFPVLAGIEALTILAEAGQTSARDVDRCAARWHAAGREVVIVNPRSGSDLNDALRGVV